jgi:hypothetical protein
MGLTIHYSLKSTTKSETKARQLVEKMRQLAMDLPFDSVSEIADLSGDACKYDPDGSPDDPLRWLLIQCHESAPCPWQDNLSFNVAPTRVIAFNVRTGPGCEDANFGLCRYPAEMSVEYKPEHDRRFYRDGRYSYSKFRRWADRTFPGRFVCDWDLKEQRTIKTRLTGWRWHSFCKTQYASNPACGGIANFLRCHVALVTLLERIGKLRTVTSEIEDEGKYGPSTYSDDWREAYAENRKPTYIWHPATYNVPTLLSELGDYNGMIAAFAGAMNDACGTTFESPILQFQNFESLEFQGHNSEALGPFLEAMATLAKSTGAAQSA